MTSRYLIIIVVFFLSHVTNSQNKKKIDSINNIIESTKLDSIKAKQHLSIAQLLIYKDSKKAKEHINFADSLYRITPNLKGIANLYSQKAHYFYTQSKLDSSVVYITKAGNQYLKSGDSLNAAITKNKLAKLIIYITRDYDKLKSIVDEFEPIAIQFKDTSLLASAIKYRADIALSKGHRNIAIKLVKKVINLREAIYDSIYLPEQYYFIGRVYQELYDYENSIINFDQGIAIVDAIKDKQLEAPLLAIKAESLVLLKRYDEAEKTLQKALKLSKVINLNTNIVDVLYRFCFLEIERENYSKADAYLKEALIFLKQVNPLDTDYNYNLCKGQINLGTKNFKLALNNFEKCIAWAEREKSLYNLRLSKKLKSQALEGLGNYKDALKVYKESSIVNDTLTSQLRTTLSMEQKIIYETEKKEQQILIQKNEIDLLNIKGKMNNLQRLLLGFGLVLALLAIYALYQKMKRNKIEKKAIKADLEFKTKELTTHALHLAKKNEVLNDLKQKAKILKESSSDSNGYQMLIRTINFDLQDDNNWENFSKYFEEIHKDFNFNAQQQYPKITSNDLRLMALLKMNLTSKEIANILNISNDGIKKARQRLRKKMRINSNDSLEALVIAI